MESLDPKAVADANSALWKGNPELEGRQLTMEREDENYRREWMQHYRYAIKHSPKPPSPQIEPEPIAKAPSATFAARPCLSCGEIASLTHEEKMLKAFELAKQKMPEEVREQLPDPAVFVGMMAVVGGILAVATFATGGLAAFAAGLLIVLAVAGAAITGYEIGQVLNGLYGFFDKSRCDRAKTEADLDAAANDLANAVAIGGVALVMAILTGLLGKAGGKVAGKAKVKATSKVPAKKVGGKYQDKEIPMKHEYIEKDKSWGVKYFSDAELESYRVVAGPNGKLTYANSGKLVDSERAIYVMDKNGNIYVHESPIVGSIHHSSLGQGKSVAGAGQMKVKNGQVIHMDENTGHYGTNQKSGTVKVVAQEMSGQGVDVSETVVKPF